jgi:hypothetical protein
VDRRVLAELVEQSGVEDIACVEDGIRLAQARPSRFRQPTALTGVGQHVGIGQHDDPHQY